MQKIHTSGNGTVGTEESRLDMSEPVVSARVDEDIYERIRERAAETDESVTAILRNLLEFEFGDEDVPVSIVGEFCADIRSAWATETDPDLDIERLGELGVESPVEGEAYRVPEEGSVLRQFATETRRYVTQTPYVERIREAVFTHTGVVYVAGHGSSLSTAHWLVSRLRREGVPARAAGAVPTAAEPIRPDDVVIGISRSGRTDTLLELFEAVPEGTTRVALTREGRPLGDRADHVVYAPPITEAVGPYASKSFLGQVLTLQEVVFDDLPSYSDLVAWSAALEAFVDAQFVSTGDEVGYRIDADSQFGRIVEEMENRGDLASAPLVASTGSGHPYGHELHLKLTEFTHTNAAWEHVSLLRDRLVNTLFREQAYLLSVLPRESESTARDRWREYLLDGPDSVRDLLGDTTDPGGDVDYRLVVLGFDSGDSPLADAVKHASTYGERAYLALDPDTSPFAPDATDPPEAFLDLATFSAVYLFAHAVLERRWRHDRQLRRTMIERVYDSEEAHDT